MTIGDGMFLHRSFIGPKLMSSRTSFFVRRCLGVSAALRFRLRNEGHTDCTIILCCCGTFRTPWAVRSSHTSCMTPFRSWLYPAMGIFLAVGLCCDVQFRLQRCRPKYPLYPLLRSLLNMSLYCLCAESRSAFISGSVFPYLISWMVSESGSGVRGCGE